jgi:pyruvate dehydrogenase E1 component alpha subunit
MANVSPEQSLYAQSMRARLIGERLSQLARAGRIGFHPEARGWEPALVAATTAMHEKDAIFPSARDHAVFFARNVAVATYVAHATGTAQDPMHGHAAPGLLASRELGIGSPSGLISNHLTHAAGWAWAARLRGDGDVAALAVLGRSAADAGDFHSAVNFAGATKAPVIFLCRTDRTLDRALDRTGERTVPAPCEAVAEKGIAYGVPTATCDAADPASVARAVSEARARAGGGPTLIEVVREAGRDPLELLRDAMIAKNVWSQTQDLEQRRELMAEIEAALSRALGSGAPPRESLFDDVFGELPPHLHAQRDQLLAAPPRSDR